MKSIWMVSMVAVVGAGCGQVAGLPWDKNHDGIVAQCEGLDRFFCGITPNCQGQELACLAICVDDGKGGCKDLCGDGFQCVPIQPIACFQLSNSQCVNDPRCELFTVQTGSNARAPEGDVPANLTRCRERQTGCESVALNSCAAIPGCHVQQVTVCSGSAGAQQAESDKAIAPPICATDTRPSEDFAAPPAPDAGAPTDAGSPCGGGCTTFSICTSAPIVNACEQSSVATCTQLPECELVNGPVCKVFCAPGTHCPPCASPALVCALKTKPNTCQNLSPNLCTASAGCRLETAVCAAVCEDDGHGGCKPCPVGQVCVPL